MSKIQTIKDALAILESLDNAQAELVSVREDHDRLRDANIELAAATDEALHVRAETQKMLADAKARADELVAAAMLKAESLKLSALDEYNTARETAEARIDAACDDERAELAKVKGQVAAAKEALAAVQAEADTAAKRLSAMEQAIAVLKASAGL